MTFSSIKVDLIDDKITISQAFDKLLIISLKLNDLGTIDWIKKEQNSYPDNNVPEYRITTAFIISNYQQLRYGILQTFTGRQLHTSYLPTEEQELLNKWICRESISSIENQYKVMSNNEGISGIPLPPNYYHFFENSMNIKVLSALIVIPELNLKQIINSVKTRIIEIIVSYEEKYGNLDNLDKVTNNHTSESFEEKNDGKTVVVIKDSIINKSNIATNNSKTKNINLALNSTNKDASSKKSSILKCLINAIFKKR